MYLCDAKLSTSRIPNPFLLSALDSNTAGEDAVNSRGKFPLSQAKLNTSRRHSDIIWTRRVSRATTKIHIKKTSDSKNIRFGTGWTPLSTRDARWNRNKLETSTPPHRGTTLPPQILSWYTNLADTVMHFFSSFPRGTKLS